MDDLFYVGITGAIGSGKSRVSRFWAQHTGLPLIDIDQICRELMDTGMPGWQALKENVGKSFFSADGQLIRPALRSAIFKDEVLRNKVNSLVHPLALHILEKRSAEMQQPVLVDVPLLFEAGWGDRFRHTVVVYADRQTCCQRVVDRDNIFFEEAVQATDVQQDIWEKAMLADHVVDNRFSWFNTCLQVMHLSQLLGRHVP